ncbi:winged helix-turn-helix domain-containing protein [Aurantiacibacter gilvus]|uniref:Winged helix-turn-helix domain-containing protein n=1 Tax=Aurantiacibacter gilvus TaxID=3139141 RepID=A0ABU9IFR1_9SPHN
MLRGRLEQASFSVGHFDVQPVSNSLEHRGVTYSVEPLVMDVLCLLAQQAGKVVTRDDLINKVWYFNPGADESLTRAVSLLRRIFRVDSKTPKYIETVWKAGYRLLAPVVEDGAEQFDSVPEFIVRPDHPDYSVAILSFNNLSTDASDAFLADGLTRDLTRMLSRVPRLRVAAYSSAALLQEGAAPAGEIARKLRVRYLVSGSLTRHGNQVSLRVSLMDGATDSQVWSHKLSTDLEQLFDVQDKLVLDLSSAMASALQISHAEVALSQRGFRLNAYELVQRAEALRMNYNAKTAQQIIALLNQALEIDPQDAAVHAGLAIQHTQNVVSNFEGTPPDAFEIARRHVDTAMRLAPNDPEVLLAAGIAATMMGNARLAVRHLWKAIERDPNNPHTLAVLGWQVCWLNGDPAGREMIELAEERAPHHPRYAVWAHYRGHCEIRLGRVRQAIAAYEDCVDRNPNYSLNLVTLAMAQSLAGRLADARATIARIRVIAPQYSPDDFEKLARRMVYWFGSETALRDSLAAFRQAWTRQSDLQAAGGVAK